MKFPITKIKKCKIYLHFHAPSPAPCIEQIKGENNLIINSLFSQFLKETNTKFVIESVEMKSKLIECIIVN